MVIKRDHKGVYLSVPFTHGKQSHISKKEEENDKTQSSK